MKNEFQQAYDSIIAWETREFHEIPGDPGGATKFGISLRFYRKLYPEATADDIKNLDEPKAERIYLREFWDPVTRHVMPFPLKLMQFDMAVNQGTKKAITNLQNELGVTADGFYGPVTDKAIEDQYGEWLLKSVHNGRIMLYCKTANFDKFGRGWVNRATDILCQALDYHNQLRKDVSC